MKTDIEISSLNFGKTSNDIVPFNKYDINVDLEEYEKSEEYTKIKFMIDFSSEPKNSSISIVGFISLYGESSQISNLLQHDDDQIPYVVHTIYQELFPLLYIVTHRMKIPCPVHNISLSSEPLPVAPTSNTSESLNNDLQNKPEDILEENIISNNEKSGLSSELEVKSNEEGDDKTFENKQDTVMNNLE